MLVLSLPIGLVTVHVTIQLSLKLLIDRMGHLLKSLPPLSHCAGAVYFIILLNVMAGHNQFNTQEILYSLPSYTGFCGVMAPLVPP